MNNSVTFNAYDRCDRCGAQAYAKADKDEMSLLFCLHDAKKNNLALESQGWSISFDFNGIERLADNEGVLV